MGDIQANVNNMLRAFSYPEISLEETRAYVGDGAFQLVKRALPQSATNVEECYEYFRTRFEQSDNSLTCLFDGEKEAIAELLRRGIKLGVVTNKPHRATVRLIEKFFEPNTFAFVEGDSGNFPLKPDPTLALYAALSLHVSPAECLFAGDGETDVETARNAGMVGVACLWGYRTKEQLTRAGATRFATSFAELTKISEKIC